MWMRESQIRDQLCKQRQQRGGFLLAAPPGMSKQARFRDFPRIGRRCRLTVFRRLWDALFLVYCPLVFPSILWPVEFARATVALAFVVCSFQCLMHMDAGITCRIVRWQCRCLFKTCDRVLLGILYAVAMLPWVSYILWHKQFRLFCEQVRMYTALHQPILSYPSDLSYLISTSSSETLKSLHGSSLTMYSPYSLTQLTVSVLMRIK